MSDISIKQEPVDDVRLCSVVAAELEVCIDTDIKIEQSNNDEPYLKRCKQEPVDFVVDDVVDETEEPDDVCCLIVIFWDLSSFCFRSRRRRRGKRPVLPNVNDALLIHTRLSDAAPAIFHLQQGLNISDTIAVFMSRRNNVQHAANGLVLRHICLFMKMRSMAKKCGIFVHIVRRVSFVEASWLHMSAEFIEKKDVLLVQFARRPL